MGVIFIGRSATLRVTTTECWSAPPRRSFNPSIQLGVDGRSDAVAVRVAGEGGSPPIALLRHYVDGRLERERNLTDECRSFDIDRVADPKLLMLDDELWVTFNTGSQQSGNELFLWHVGAEGTRPLRCVLDGRARIEKNWQFFRRSGRLGAVYSIDPLVLLESPRPPREGSELVFDVRTGTPPSASRTMRQRLARRSFSLGAPLLSAGPHTYRTIVHEKFHLAGKRLYVGRPAELSVGDAPAMRLGRDRLAYSWAGLIGTHPRLNPNLVSCTYFSGISGDPARPVLSFGLNDARAGFVRCQWDEVFR